MDAARRQGTLRSSVGQGGQVSDLSKEVAKLSRDPVESKVKSSPGDDGNAGSSKRAERQAAAAESAASSGLTCGKKPHSADRAASSKASKRRAAAAASRFFPHVSPEEAALSAAAAAAASASAAAGAAAHRQLSRPTSSAGPRPGDVNAGSSKRAAAEMQTEAAAESAASSGLTCGKKRGTAAAWSSVAADPSPVPAVGLTLTAAAALGGAGWPSN